MSLKRVFLQALIEHIRVLVTCCLYVNDAKLSRVNSIVNNLVFHIDVPSPLAAGLVDDILMATWLPSMILTGQFSSAGKINTCTCRRNSTYSTTSIIATYSDSEIANTVTSWVLKCQLIPPPPPHQQHRYDTKHRVFGHIVWSESAFASISIYLSCPPYVMPRSTLPNTSGRIFSTAFLCATPAFSHNLGAERTEYAISGYIMVAAHKSTPTASLLGNLCVLSSSSGVCGPSSLDSDLTPPVASPSSIVKANRIVMRFPECQPTTSSFSGATTSDRMP